METVFQEVLDWDSRATRRDTPYGQGSLAWRIWGEGPPALLIHGNSGSWTHWIRNLGALSRSHTLYVPDLPGHGDSSAAGESPTMQGFAESIWQGLDMLLPEGSKIDVLGFSLGSVIGECMKTQRPAQVDRLVLLRGSFTPKLPKLPENVVRWRDIRDPLDMARAQRHNLSVLMFHDPGKIDDLAVYTHTQNLLRCTLDIRPLLASRPAQLFENLCGTLHGVSGEYDIYGGGDVAAQGRELLKTHPDATFHLVPDAGHWAMYEAADKVNPILAGALAR